MSDSGAARKQFSKTEISEHLRALGVRRAEVLLVHASFRSMRPIEGGPLGLIEVLLDTIGPSGTLAMPSFSGDDDTPFDLATSPAAPDLGIIADTFWRMPGVRRSNHCFAFAALGPYAATITADPLPLPPHILKSPVGRVHDLGGEVLLLGTGHDANTALHLAEILANVPYRVPRHCTVLRDDHPARIDYEENDHCCENFALADGWLRERGFQSEARVGHARARLARARDIVTAAVENLTRDPLAFLHRPHAGCAQCDEARKSLSVKS